MARSFTLDAGWARYKRAVNIARFTPKMKQEIEKASLRNGKLAERQIRREIRGGVPPASQALTVTLKGGGRPLVGTKGADLWNSVTSNLESWSVVWAGVKRMANRGGRNWNVAEIVHEGGVAKVTPAMRTMFLLLSWASQRWRGAKPGPIPHLEGRAKVLWEMSRTKRFFPLKPGTKRIVIPPRPFIRYAFQERSLKSAVESNWKKAVDRAIRKNAR